MQNASIKLNLHNLLQSIALALHYAVHFIQNSGELKWLKQLQGRHPASMDDAPYTAIEVIQNRSSI